MAQRLARRLCQQCKEPFPIDEQAAKYLGLTPGETVFKGKGCDACGGKGVKGRVGIYEVMVMNARLRKLIAASALTEEIHQAAIEEGMLDLKAYSVWLIRNGLTTVEEVLQVVSVQD